MSKALVLKMWSRVQVPRACFRVDVADCNPSAGEAKMGSLGPAA